MLLVEDVARRQVVGVDPHPPVLGAFGALGPRRSAVQRVAPAPATKAGELADPFSVVLGAVKLVSKPAEALLQATVGDAAVVVLDALDPCAVLNGLAERLEGLFLPFYGATLDKDLVDLLVVFIREFLGADQDRMVPQRPAC